MKPLKITPMIFLGLLTSSMHIISNHKLNDLGQTELIQYIIKQDALIKEAENKVYKLERNCFQEEKSFNDNKKSKYYFIGSPEELRALANAQEQLEELLTSTLNKINHIASDTAQLAVKDKFGKTALNYCYTPAIYNKLREVGVPFQYDAWLYFNGLNAGGKLMFGGIIAAAAISIANDYYHLHTK